MLLEDDSEASRLHARRATDAHQEKIDTLIAEEPDSKVRLTLMVMSSINKSIAANTELTYAVHREVKSLGLELDSHITAEAAIKNKGLGVYAVAKVVVPAIWFIMLSIITYVFKDYSSFQSGVSMDMIKIQGKISEISTKIDAYESDKLIKRNK